MREQIENNNIFVLDLPEENVKQNGLEYNLITTGWDEVRINNILLKNS